MVRSLFAAVLTAVLMLTTWLHPAALRAGRHGPAGTSSPTQALQSRLVRAAASNNDCDDAWRIVTSKTISRANPGYNRLWAVTAVHPDRVWAVGMVPAADRRQPLIRSWDGTRWQQDATPISATEHGELFGVDALASNEVWAVGRASMPDSSSSRSMILRWYGRT